MVDRRLNKPVAKVGPHVLFWLNQVVSGPWNCRRCHKDQEKGSTAFEMCVPYTHQVMNAKDGSLEQRPIRVYLCCECAILVLEDAVEKVKICQNVGAQGYMVMDKL